MRVSWRASSRKLKASEDAYVHVGLLEARSIRGGTATICGAGVTLFQAD